VGTRPVEGRREAPGGGVLYGGGYSIGSSGSALYDGENVAKRGAVFVNLNYRLGILGNMAHPELAAESPHNSSGNYGFLDQVAALKWIQRNIARFGGDPGNVTISGQSAGGESVAILVASPQAKGLFQRAISQSGNYGLPLDEAERPQFDRTTAEATGLAFARGTGATSLADLRKLSADDLLKKPWAPRTIVDGRVLRDDLTTTYRAGRQNHVPILVGWNADEGKDRSSIFRFVTDDWGWRIWHWARLHQAKATDRAYVYYFVHSPAEPSAPCGYGCNAGHGAEIRYMFDQLDQDDRAWNAEDRRLASQLAGYWTTFAKSGDPNGADLPGWKPFDGSEGSVQRLGSDEEIAARGRLPAFGLFEP
jgi:para-nitrobenzyl esterase